MMWIGRVVQLSLTLMGVGGLSTKEREVEKRKLCADVAVTETCGTVRKMTLPVVHGWAWSKQTMLFFVVGSFVEHLLAFLQMTVPHVYWEFPAKGGERQLGGYQESIRLQS